MKTKSFKKYLATRLDEKEIADIKKQAWLEITILRLIQRGILARLFAFLGKDPQEVFKRKK